tara:strand:- start:8979 stop:9320 length:342 start_codon:yes stop_codon:yes gene_type:complete
MWNKNICLTSRTTLMVILGVLLSTIAIAAVFSSPKEEIVVPEVTTGEEEQMWVPTKEDIAYQDSMYGIILKTQSDLDTIKKEITYILERLDYADGSWDSIRYVKGGTIDKRRN